MAQYAITREISASLGQCELTHQARLPIDLALARQQHARYEKALERLECTLLRLPEEPELPDAVFVEDMAVVLDEVAIVTRPGAIPRRAEIESVATALLPYRSMMRIEPPGTLDGGDVLVVGRDVYVGISSRTNQHSVDQMKHLLAPYDYQVHGVNVHGCLHLKSAVTAVAENTLLVNPEWIDSSLFAGYEIIRIDPGEVYGSNGLLIGESVVYPVTFPRTAERLDTRGIRLEFVDLSELAKAEGAVTCCSLVFEHSN
ncbi:dimethylarginine dimethylaminohydrolase family protein [Candidatus Bipolaricaulota bacterium]